MYNAEVIYTDWAKAKNISILAFVLLNVMLMLLRYVDSRRYMLSMESQRAIITVLNNNNITLGDEFRFPRYYPERQMSLSHINFNQNNMINIFMIDNQNIRIESDYNRSVFQNNYESVTFKGNRIIYENIGNTQLNIENENDARIFSVNTIRSLGEMGRSFVLDKKIVENDSIVLQYRQIYRNNILFSNYMIFMFENNNIRKIEFSYNRFHGFIGNARELSSADEILVTFMRQVRRTHCEQTPIQVQKMDLVHKKIEPSTSNKDSLVAVPFYRIHYTVNGEKNQKIQVILVNAYYNTLK